MSQTTRLIVRVSRLFHLHGLPLPTAPFRRATLNSDPFDVVSIPGGAARGRTEGTCMTPVCGRNPANQLEVGSLSHYLEGFIHPRWWKLSINWWLDFSHQQYHHSWISDSTRLWFWHTSLVRHPLCVFSLIVWNNGWWCGPCWSLFFNRRLSLYYI